MNDNNKTAKTKDSSIPDISVTFYCGPELSDVVRPYFSAANDRGEEKIQHCGQIELPPRV